jgi:hypothetical protein
MKKYVLGQKRILKDRDGIGETEIKRREREREIKRRERKTQRQK